MPWIKSAIGTPLPRSAIVGGRDVEGNVIYIGRSWASEDLLPCSIVPAKRTAYTTYRGKILIKEHYEVLCGDTYRWVRASNGEVPAGALIGGRTADGDQIFIGRASHKGGLLLGKVTPSARALLCPLDALEKGFEEYEVLTLRSADNFGRCCKSCIIC